MWVGKNMVDPGSIEGRRPPDDPVYFVALVEEELGEVRAVLPCDTCYQSFFWNSAHSPVFGNL